MSLTVGDIVYLRSGGPDMTVTAVISRQDTMTDMIQCVWFDSSGARQQGDFNSDLLDKR